MDALLGERTDTHGIVCDKTVMPELHPAWQHAFATLERAREIAEPRAASLQESMNEMSPPLGKQGDTLSAIQKMLRRRETQLKNLERENRRLRRALGLDDPNPEPTAATVPDEDEDTVEGDASSGDVPSGNAADSLKNA